MSYIMFYIPFLSFNKTRWNVFLKSIKLFLWRKSFLNQRAMHWISRDYACKPTQFASLGILNMQVQAAAICAKFLVHFHNPQQSWTLMLTNMVESAKVYTLGGSWKHLSWKQKLISNAPLVLNKTHFS